MNNDTPETDSLARGNHVVPTGWAKQLERERDEARTLESAVDVIMAAPISDILRLFRERGILATMATTTKEGAK